jgi:hypothetical protein
MGKSRSASMARHIRNLLMIAALCWVAPVSAARFSPAEPYHVHVSGCPDAARQAQQIVIVSEAPLGEVPLSAAHRAFMP